ncbi:MAG: cytochrome-c oxidase, cbb3-type subunit III [Bauldia sp.]
MAARSQAPSAASSGVEIDAATGKPTTGHEWDGVKELNQPLPRWWVWTYLATVVFAAVYVVLYPAIPMVRSATTGVLGYSTRASVEDGLAALRAGQAANLEKIRTLPLTAIRANDDLYRFAVAGGRSAFLVNCVQCHGSGAQGGKGYPNLNDDDWLWGGSLSAIEKTIQHGIRFAGDPETRAVDMPPFADVLKADDIAAVSDYVLTLSGQATSAPLAAKGKPLFADMCSSCHGEKGEGNRDLGAPALKDAVWLYASDRGAIAAQIAKPRNGVMPAWASRLDAVTIKQLALYVHSLGGGEVE